MKVGSFEVASTLTAFNSTGVVGIKVVNHEGFFTELAAALESYSTTEDRVPGQHFVVLPKTAHSTVSAGVGKKREDRRAYVISLHHGQPGIFLNRALAVEVEELTCIVYTREAYLADPGVAGDAAEVERIGRSGCSHVVVAVHASPGGPMSPPTPYQLVRDLVTGDHETHKLSASEIHEQARKSKEYWKEWVVVAD